MLLVITTCFYNILLILHNKMTRDTQMICLLVSYLSCLLYTIIRLFTITIKYTVYLVLYYQSVCFYKTTHLDPEKLWKREKLCIDAAIWFIITTSQGWLLLSHSVYILCGNSVYDTKAEVRSWLQTSNTVCRTYAWTFCDAFSVKYTNTCSSTNIRAT